MTQRKSKVVRKKRGTTRSAAIRTAEDYPRDEEGKVIVGPDSPDPRFRGLAKWKPGQSGNPQGSSRKQRRTRFLKEVLQDALAMELPESWRGKLAELELDNPGLSIDLLEGEDITIAQVIGARVVVAALLGDTKAIDQILTAEPKTIELDVEGEIAVPIKTTDARVDEVIDILQENKLLNREAKEETRH